MNTKTNYTKEALSNALLNLLQKYPIDNITVSQLVDKANVSRGAFYNHYNNLEEILKETYYQAHQIAFGNKLEDIDYLLSDEYIIDMIDFFDQNSKLLLAVFKWNLLSMIPKGRTDMVIENTRHYDDPIIQEYSFYFLPYAHVQYFSICIAWLLNHKKETPDKLFHIIKHFESIKNKTK